MEPKQAANTMFAYMEEFLRRGSFKTFKEVDELRESHRVLNNCADTIELAATRRDKEDPNSTTEK